jgi:beta-mannosidase
VKTSGIVTGDQVRVSLHYEDTVLPRGLCIAVRDGLFKYVFSIKSPKLWYPRGFGAQDRYTIRDEIIRDERAFDQQTKAIGFRKVELIQEPDEYGKSFYFRINQIDVFAGGSCWIPASNHLSELSEDSLRNQSRSPGQNIEGKYQDWIQILAEGNQTMVRIWGGKY